MNTPLPNQIIREITPLSDKDCFYIAERYKTEFTYPIHNHSEFELNFTEKAAGVRRVVGDNRRLRRLKNSVRITERRKSLSSAFLRNVYRVRNQCNRVSYSFLVWKRPYPIKDTVVSLLGYARFP